MLRESFAVSLARIPRTMELLTTHRRHVDDYTRTASTPALGHCVLVVTTFIVVPLLTHRFSSSVACFIFLGLCCGSDWP